MQVEQLAASRGRLMAPGVDLLAGDQQRRQGSKTTAKGAEQ